MRRIAIIDYGMGNLRSVQKALQHLGFDAFITADTAEVSAADGAVLPGVGAFADAITQLKSTGMDECVRAYAQSGKPLLGICLGMQLFFEKSLEGGCHDGLGLLPGAVVPIPPAPGRKIPHMGWNALDIRTPGGLLHGLQQGDHVYFVHSFYADTPAENITAVCDYGFAVTAAVQRGNIMATQFHPEKSGDIGLRILKNFGGML